MKKLVIALLSVAGLSLHAAFIINGTPVNQDDFKEVVEFGEKGRGCTAVIVGPQVAISTAHCAKDHGAITLNSEKKIGTYIRYPGYPVGDIDLGVLVLFEKLTDRNPVSIATDARTSKGDVISILGYGCTQPGGGRGNDRILRSGIGLVVRLEPVEFVIKGSALCYGDSGSPAYLGSLSEKKLVGIGVKGNISDTSWFTDLSNPKVTDFLHRVIKDYGVEICGINKVCKSEFPPPPPPKFGQSEEVGLE